MTSNIHTISIPDMVVPSQWHRRPGWTPEQRLLHAVLEDAIWVLHTQNYLYRLSLRSFHLYKEAYDWVHDDDQSYIFSFRPLCDALRLDPDAVRAALDAECAAYPPKAPSPQRGPRKPRSDKGKTKPRATRRLTY